jgi:hypothetical protein
MSTPSRTTSRPSNSSGLAPAGCTPAVGRARRALAGAQTELRAAQEAAQLVRDEVMDACLLSPRNAAAAAAAAAKVAACTRRVRAAATAVTTAFAALSTTEVNDRGTAAAPPTRDHRSRRGAPSFAGAPSGGTADGGSYR